MLLLDSWLAIEIRGFLSGVPFAPVMVRERDTVEVTRRNRLGDVPLGLTA
ncbi:hypothetical protein [Nocardia sp. NPDC049149]